mgnify:CR=1 FL=1
MANIQKLEERMEELALRIEEQKEKAHTYLGEEIFKLFEIPYENVDTKKDAKEVAELIYSSIEENPFTEKEHEDFTEGSSDNYDSVSELNVEQ